MAARELVYAQAAGSTTDSVRIDSWKEIARYLGRGTRTVQRWEREEELPVHRLQHGKLGSVYAYKSELDAWFVSRGAALEADPVADVSAAADAIPSIAVLPFMDLSQDGDQAYFCDGIAEEIINALGRLPGLRTSSRTSSFRFRTTGAGSCEIASELGVDSLLEGSVRRSGDRLRIAVQLVDARTGFPLWSERYDRTFNDVFEVQDDIAASVVDALKVRLTPTCAVAPQTIDAGAYECYLRGRKYYYEYSSRAMEFAIRMFVRAIELDPAYARAYAGLADCWSYSYLYEGRSEELREQADWASAHAVEMDPGSPQAQASRGLSLSLNGQVAEADQAFAEAVRIDPDLYEAHFFRARHCFSIGRIEEASAAYAEAARVRPDDYQSLLLGAQMEDDLGRPERAAEIRKRGLAIAERHLQLNPDDARATYLAANGLAAMGERNRSRLLAERAIKLRPDDPMLLYNVGCTFALLGLPGEAVDCLAKAARGGMRQIECWLRDSNLDSLRDDARFLKLVREMEQRTEASATA